jgi:hypothetical protein
LEGNFHHWIVLAELACVAPKKTLEAGAENIAFRTLAEPPTSLTSPGHISASLNKACP